jgi:23S rRNA (uracil1939-C5)-methyltransferase
LARTPEGVLFISDVLPGEIVEYCIEGKQEGIPLAKPVKILEVSKDRRNPDCPYFGECGGCDWLYIDYNCQVEIKKEVFIDCLKRIGKIREIPTINIYSSPEKSYRMRAQFKIDNGKYGFYRKKTNDVIRIARCPLLTEQCNSVLDTLNKSSCQINGKSVKIIDGDNHTASDPEIKGITNRQTEITIGNSKFLVYGGSFFQSNTFLAETMGNWASPMTNGGTCVDLYGGTGFFSVMLRKQFAKGYMIESVKSQVEVAKLNLSKNNINHFKAICSDAEHIRSTVNENVDFLIVDPPRPGLTKIVRKSIISIGPSKILYVSCNPSTQARDVNVFVNAGYRIKKAALFDCYPNTHHIETALILEKT